MGIRVSIDKHVSNLEELLEMSPSYFSRLKFESKVDSAIQQHLKVRKFRPWLVLDLEIQWRQIKVRFGQDNTNTAWST